MNAEDGKQDSCESENAAYREIDTRGYDDQGHTAGQDGEYRYVSEHIPMGIPFKESPLSVEQGSKR